MLTFKSYVVKSEPILLMMKQTSFVKLAARSPENYVQTV